ncbi:Guanine-nucleotide dissociation stimulator, CDC24, conserved site,Dbl homology (DH) domain,PH domain- [Cinara cedri]|uniref:Guanine-nucleotide dissociation stimulator, CDC24, conserved site,Dbl homology (DH) domain,PH domain n=1 Tax=Cinara cedri TaxID=506608 RepID=A0A5E4NPL0_9HEMI|nr:Guanine-nucleotide dissociation stimulator, CDC24, conserved site,Dbl homology (DH) domain,PH domain- [Cinara cedri]
MADFYSTANPNLKTSELSAPEVTASSSADLPKIEETVKEEMEQGPSTSTMVDLESQRAEALRKREYVVQEFVETERNYVMYLSKVVHGYMAVLKDPMGFGFKIPTPKILKPALHKNIFGNIETIYEWHRDVFLSAVEECATQPHLFGKLFQKYKRKLHMYVIYCWNKSCSDLIMINSSSYFEKIRIELGYKLQLSDILIKPIQRIMKYKLLLEEMLKYTKRAGLTNEIEMFQVAIEIMKYVPRVADDMIIVSKLEGFDGNIIAQGDLLLHDNFDCARKSEDEFKSTEFECETYENMHVFLFEKCIIFSKEINKMYVKKKQCPDRSPNELLIIESMGGLKKPPMWIVCSITNPKLQSEWWLTLNEMQKQNQEFLKAIMSPITYQRQLTEEAAKSLDRKDDKKQ